MKRNQLFLIATVSLLLLLTHTAAAQTTAFTYQGKLTDSGNLANGNYDLQFKLFDTVTVGTGTQQGSNVTVLNVTVTNGIFTVQLDFGVCAPCFDGSARFLEIAVRLNGGGSFTTLTPRQPITSTPYAINAAQLGGLAASGFLQNSTTQQASSNFNISGTGTANILNATTQFNLGGQQVLSAPGSNNLFAGISAGTNNTGSSNAFFGFAAGQANTTGNRNAFFGKNAGFSNITGFDNAFFGAFAGVQTTTGTQNVFFGETAGNQNTIGNFNTFIGRNADFDVANPTGDNNTLLGGLTRVTSGFSNATAIGFRAQVSQSNALVLGSINGVNGGTDTTVGIGTTTPAALLDVQRDGAAFPEIARFTSYGNPANTILARSSNGTRAAPTATPNGRALMLLGATGHDGTNFVANPGASIVMDTAEAWSSTAQGTQIRFRTTQNGTAATALTTRMIITNDGKVGIGTSAPQFKLDVVGDINTTTQYDIGGLRSFAVNGAFNDGTTIFTASNTFAGDGAGLNTMPSPTLNSSFGKFNTFYGAGAGQANTTGGSNAFFGAQAGQNGGGGGNSFFGFQAGQANTSNDNAFFGNQAGIVNTSGCCNSFFGNKAGNANTSGDRNAFFGSLAGFSNLGGSFNTFIGDGADFNSSNSTGDNNTLLGANARVTSGISNATAIGANSLVTESDSLVLGDGSVFVGIGTTAPLNKLHVAGDIRVGTGTTGCVRDADGTQIAGTCSSDARLKHSITPFPHLLDKLVQLQPVTFYWRREEFKERHFGSSKSFGLIAQEVEKVLPELVTEDEQGFKAVNYSKLPLLSLQAIKELKQENDQLKQENVAIKQENQTIRQQQQTLQAQFQALRQVVCKVSPSADICKP